MTQDILITPGSGEPQILFRGSGTNDTPIELNVLSSYQSATGSGTALVFEGQEGQLFAVTDNLSSGTIFSVGDITGLSMLSVDASGDVKLGEFANSVIVYPGLTLDDNVPSTTSNVLYNDGGDLMWNGVTVVESNATQAVDGSGTASYVARFTDTNTLGTGVIYDNGTNVGIGTASPSYKLDVQDSSSNIVWINAGSSSQTANYAGLRLTSNTGGSQIFKNGNGYASYGGANSLNIWDDGPIAFHPNNTANALYLATNGNVGIGTTSVTQKLDIRYPAGGGMALLKSTDTNDGLLFGDMAYSLNNDLQGMKHAAMTGVNDYMIISEGTNTYVSAKSGYNLYLRSGGNLVNSEISLSSTEVVVNNNSSNLDFRVESNNDANALFVDGVTDYVGIGTASPGAKLDVQSNTNAASIIRKYNLSGGSSAHAGVAAQSDYAITYILSHANARTVDRYGFAIGGYSEILAGGTNNGLLIGTSNLDNPIVFGNNSTERMRIAAGGNVGIGTDSPNAVLHAYGSTPSGTVFNVEGTNGSLFSVVDNLSGVLMSVNNNAGLPVFEVNDDDSIVAGRFAQNDFVVTTSGDIGMGTANPASKLEVNGTITGTSFTGDGTGLTGTAASLTAGAVTNGVYTTGNQTVGGVKTFSSQIISTAANNAANGGGQIYLSGAAGNRIDFNNNGVAPPAFTTRSAGTKIVLFPALNASSVDYGFGIDGGTLWSSVPSNSQQFKWYGGTTSVATLNGNGVLTVAGSSSQINVDNLRLDGNTLSSTNTNGNVIITPNGTGGIAAGTSATVTGQYAVVGGGLSNTASGFLSTVSGGYNNTANVGMSTVGGGRDNTASGQYSTVGGGGGIGRGNTASGNYSTVSGGVRNTASNSYSTVSGGYCNTASGFAATVGGGIFNCVSDIYSTVSGGYSNSSSACYSTVSGGRSNTASGSFSTVGGGKSNTASGCYSSISGGKSNNDNGCCNVHILGSNITATAADTTYTENLHVTCALKINKFDHTNLSVASSFADTDVLVAVIDPTGTASTEALQGSVLRSSLLNQPAQLQFRQGTDAERQAITPASGEPIWTTDNKEIWVGDGTTCGGLRMGPSMHKVGTCTGAINTVNGSNTSSGSYSTVGGGCGNTASGTYGGSTVSGGVSNTASGTYSTVGGGCGNIITAIRSTIGGGFGNSVLGIDATIGGGYCNCVTCNCTTIGGGLCNIACANNSTVSGGMCNTASGRYSVVGGGRNNTAYGTVATTIAGGQDNATFALFGGATISGGLCNTSCGTYTSIGGGRCNTTSANYSIVVGGKDTKASRYGEVTHAAGKFAQQGDAQHSTFVARKNTTDATANVELFLDGVDDRMILAAETTWTFDIKLSAYNDTDNTAAWWIFRGGIRRDAADFMNNTNTTLIGSLIEERDYEGTMSGTSATVTADDTNESLKIAVTGLASKNIRWVAVVDVAQVSWGTP